MNPLSKIPEGAESHASYGRADELLESLRDAVVGAARAWVDEQFNDGNPEMELTPAIETLGRAVENLITAEALVVKAGVAAED